MSTIKIGTAKSGFEVGGRHFGRSRHFSIYIDGTKAGTIPNGQKESFVVPAGAHTILARTDMGWKSHERSLDIKENDARTFYLQPSSKRVWIFVPLFTYLFCSLLLRIARAEASLALISPFLVLYALLLLFGRKTPWLTLTEI